MKTVKTINLGNKLVFAAGIAAVALASTGGVAHAYIGQKVNIPSVHGCASGNGSLTSQSNSSSRGQIYLRNTCGGRKYYVQIKLAIPNSPDFAAWQKVDAEINGAGSRTFNWSDSHSRVYNGVKFRICWQRGLQGDECGGESPTVKR